MLFSQYMASWEAKNALDDARTHYDFLVRQNKIGLSSSVSTTCTNHPDETTRTSGTAAASATATATARRGGTKEECGENNRNDRGEHHHHVVLRGEGRRSQESPSERDVCVQRAKTTNRRSSIRPSQYYGRSTTFQRRMKHNLLFNDSSVRIRTKSNLVFISVDIPPGIAASDIKIHYAQKYQFLILSLIHI